MAEIVLFHHVLGLTPGVVALADALRADGHIVHTPDLYGGRTFPSILEASAWLSSPEAPDLDALADAAVAELPESLVYVGISSGVMPAQRLAQTRPGARAAVLLEACVSVSEEWSYGPWPAGLPVQIHGMAQDPFFAGEGDLAAAQELVGIADDAELSTYPGDTHLFVDSSLPSYDPGASELVLQRIRELLARV